MKSFKKDTSLRDLLIVVLVTILVTFQLIKFDAFEAFFEITREYENLELDEVGLGIVVFSLGITWFAFRRWLQGGQLIRQLKATEQELVKSNKELDSRVKDRTRDLESAQHRLIDQAHKAGMADIAASTLHNVGNLLNNIKTSAQLIKESVELFPVGELKKASMLLEANKEDLEGFICHDPKGKKLLEYYLKLGHELTDQRIDILTNFVRLNEKIDAIVQVISSQYKYPDMNQIVDKYDLREIIEDSLSIVSESLSKQQIKINTLFNPVPDVKVNKTKLVSILINLSRNAEDALMHKPVQNREITISVKADDKAVVVEFRDNGKGVPTRDLERIFSFGFTTKEGRHGYGLHSCANYMSEMGHRIWAENDNDEGTRFVLYFNI